MSIEPTKRFQAGFSYNPATNVITYLSDDCCYREQRIDDRLSVLWHPTEQRIVGVHIHNASFLIDGQGNVQPVAIQANNPPSIEEIVKQILQANLKVEVKTSYSSNMEPTYDQVVEVALLFGEVEISSDDSTIHIPEKDS